MMGRKKLSEIKAELGLSGAQANGKSPKAKPTLRQEPAELEKTLTNKLAQLERELKKRRKPKTRKPAEH